MSKYIIAIDQGTTSSRALIFDKDQNIISLSQKEFTQIYPKEGWVEHDPMEIWATQYGVLQEAMAKANITQEDIAAIGITNQRETTIVWDRRTGKPIYNAIVWQCRRTADICKELKEEGLERYINDTTGLVIDAYFSGTKIKWILDNVKGARKKAEKGDLLFGTIDTWLVWKLTKGRIHITDYTNASRTMLYDIKNLKWDDFILNKLKIPKSMLPDVRNSSEIYGYTNLGVKGGVQIPIAGIAGDQQASLFGHACFHKGDTKNTYGTGCFLLMNTGNEIIKSNNGLITTIAIGIDGKIQYALEGSVFIGGAIVQWLRDELQLISNASETEECAKRVLDNGGVYIVPAFVGLGAPYWNMDARGAILGLTRGTNKNHIIRAALESIAYQSKDVLDAMIEDTGYKIENLKVDGGASRNNLLMQFQSNMINVPIKKPIITETTAVGAAYLAGLAVGFWSNKKEITQNWYTGKVFTPNLDNLTRDRLYLGWLDAIKKVQS